MPYYPRRHGKPWTKRELNELFVLIQTDIPWGQIANSLQRTITAVYSKYQLFRQIELLTYGQLEDTITSIPKKELEQS
jgi:hypothetical protein